jgi:phage-related tail fiber protein
MDFIQTSNKQTDKFGSGKHGFKPGNPGTGELATFLSNEWCDTVQQEIVNVVEGAGLTPTVGVRNQMYLAIQAMIYAAVVQDYKASARYTTTANITLSGLGTQAGGDWPSALTANDRIFVKDQTTGSQNGIYVAAAGAWTRATDADGAGELTAGAVVLVEEGTANADSQWMLTTDGMITIGTTSLNFLRQSGSGQQAGEVCFFARNTAPTGFLKANGAAVSRTTYAALFAAIYKSSTVTMTIAAPGVVSWSGFTPSPNDAIEFTTTGALPTGFVTATKYYVVGASIVPGVSFQLSATPGGTAITTAGSQSGIHTAHNAPFGIGDGSTTFNVPDLRGEFLRGWDDSRAIDASRSFGSLQLDDFKTHVHQEIGTNSGATGSGSVGISGPGYSGTNTAATGGTETRPRNVALLACIRY